MSETARTQHAQPNGLACPYPAGEHCDKCGWLNPGLRGRIRLITFNGVYGMMVVPYCPHEGCGWSMPELWCPEHGNFGMTFWSAKVGPLTHVKASLS